MKRIYLLGIIMLAFSHLISAQRLFKYIYADTNDESIGKAARVSELKYGSMLGEIEAALTWVNSPAIVVRDSFDCNKEMLLKDLNALDCSSEDVVIFIYCGHGTRSLEDMSDFPQMCFAKPQTRDYHIADDFYLLENVRNLIMQKCPRMCLVIGDCCNSYDPNLPPIDIFSDGMGSNVKKLDGPGAKCCRDLFLSKYGSVMLTASVKGEYGWCDSRNGMVLQNNVSNEFRKVIKELKCYDNWESLLSTIRDNTKATSIMDKQGKRWTQTPIYRIELSDKLSDKCSKTEPKPNPTDPTLKADLLKIANNKSYTMDERRLMRTEVLNTYFDSKDALIDIVGNHGTIVMSTTIEKYLLRISTEKNMVNLVIFNDEKAKSGKTMYLKLHEIYSEE
ncbi:MAG: caspase family protein [Paludibacteraceae bacterium]|nr:caspase family protein [Paludibacteraceae bacterium]